MAILKLRRQLRIAAQQGGGGVVVALGLKNLVTFYRAQLTHRPIHRAHHGCIGQGAQAGAQCAREEIVEARVAGDVGLGSLTHVNAVARHESADCGRGHAAGMCRGQPAGKGGEQLFGQQILRKHGEAVRHVAAIFGKNSRAIL